MPLVSVVPISKSNPFLLFVLPMADEIDDRSECFQDWRGEEADPEVHGGVRAASFACVVEVLETTVFVSNGTNFVAYFLKSLHYSAAESSNMVTNFMGTSFLLTIVGGFISDSFLTKFTTFVLFCTIELLGLILLTVQAETSQLQPAANTRPSYSQAAMLYTGLYTMATGVGGIKAALPAHGADQLDHSNQRQISSFFNWFFFSICTGALLAATVMIWIEENKGWNWSFTICIVILSLALFIFVSGFRVYRYKRPTGSPLSRIFKVIASAIRNRKDSGSEVRDHVEAFGATRSGDKFRLLDKSLLDDTVTAADVKETKAFLGLLPIFASTIMMNCCLAQLQTFSVQQGIIMNRTLGSNFQIPTQSLAVFPLIIMLASIPLYERSVHILESKIPAKYNIFLPLKRMGLGLALASVSMAVASLVEVKRRHGAERHVTLSVFWLLWQYLLLGISDMLTLGGMLEFFYSEAPRSMRSMSTALSWCSTALGFFLSSVLVSVTNSVSGKYGSKWLGGNDLNQNRLDLFYALLGVLDFINFLNYMFWAKRY